MWRRSLPTGVSCQVDLLLQSASTSNDSSASLSSPAVSATLWSASRWLGGKKKGRAQKELLNPKVLQFETVWNLATWKIHENTDFVNPDQTKVFILTACRWHMRIFQKPSPCNGRCLAMCLDLVVWFCSWVKSPFNACSKADFWVSSRKRSGPGVFNFHQSICFWGLLPSQDSDASPKRDLEEDVKILRLFLLLGTMAVEVYRKGVV